MRKMRVSRRSLWAAAGVVLFILILDFTRAPRKQVSARVLLVAIDVYQATLSPILSATGNRCRFTLSCSRYGEAAIRRHGALKGSALAAGRVLRCGPWTPMDTEDPPP